MRLADRREFKGKVLGADKATDIAVVKIEANGLPVVKLGDPSNVRVGEWVLAIGSPFGFESTVTVGIVSATVALAARRHLRALHPDRRRGQPRQLGRAALQPASGEVIGINSQIYSRTGGFQGIAFAIPINVATQVQAELVKHGRVERGRIGVSIQEVTQSLAQSFGLERPQGALVSSVEEGSPAQKAGLKPGDVVLAVNGKPIERSAELPPLVAAVKPGTEGQLRRVARRQEADARGHGRRAQDRAGGERRRTPGGRRGHGQARPRRCAQAKRAWWSRTLPAPPRKPASAPATW